VLKPLLIIPPLTQLNTPYPATAYLTGFLNQQGIQSRQKDLGLDMVLEVFSKKGFERLFDAIEQGDFKLSQSLDGMVKNRLAYERTVDAVVSFLQNKNYTLGYRIANGAYLPEGARFKQIKDLEWFFGNIGVQDKARYKCTMYLEDVSDLIQATVGPHFGFSKYAERIARTAVSFNPILNELLSPTNYLDEILEKNMAAYFSEEVPQVVGFTVPFGGNLYGALKAGQWIKKHFPQTQVVMGGGYANTELRELSDPRVFDFVDYITLDDGEGPFLALLKHLEDPIQNAHLKRTFRRTPEGKVEFVDTLEGGDFLHSQKPAPKYEGLRFHDYLSVIDMPNPMHRLWNDGRWNKMTVAHGCYWKKCSFCDITLDYIGRYDQTSAAHLVDQMQELIAETGETGFHFVDEAAPPAALRDLAVEILRRGLQVSWWTNIRFEKTFTPDLCQLLAASGCIAVTGGLEVASPRILALIDKGISIDQVARVCAAFRDSGILVHAYLMFGFPTQTAQETIDSLEVVRQLFENQLLLSGHWHQFAMTVHSPVGKDPEKYGVIRTGPVFEGFANNDLFHEDPKGADHELFSDGLKKALYNYMHGVGFDFPLKKFFNFPIPNPVVPRTLIERSLKWIPSDDVDAKGMHLYMHETQIKVLKQKGKVQEVLFLHKRGYEKLELPCAAVEFLIQNENRFSLLHDQTITLNEVMHHLSQALACTAQELVEYSWWKAMRKYVWMVRL
jgi:radical SAM superfamily enzyme YgiQ (UPF0313 family)